MAHLPRLLAFLSLLTVTACAQASAPVEDDSLGATTSPPDVPVVQVTRSGGFLPVGEAFRSVPSASVYGDGRVIAPGAQIAVYPGPALPSISTGRLPAEQVQQLVEQGRAALDEEADYGQPPVADAPTTVVSVGAGDDRLTAAALALDLLPPDPTSGVTQPQSEARERLSSYVRQVEQAATDAATQPYEAERMAVLVLPDAGPALEGGAAEEVEWPGPPLPAGDQGCVVVRGDELAEVRAAAASATQETAWTHTGTTWRLAFRPLLPHEQTCDDATTEPVPASP